MVSAANAINATLYDKLNFVFLRDITPVASIERSYIVMLVNPSVPSKTVPEFIAYAEANPGRINMASAGVGAPSISHISAGTMRPLAVTTMARSAVLPDLPSVSEFIPDYEASAVWGLGAPRNTPVEIIDRSMPLSPTLS
jgi:tripartite-type tricarboxylate transporter receptor subunit TctC